MIEGNDIVSEDLDVANTFNTFFDNAVKSLGVCIPEECITDSTGVTDPIEAIVLRYASHPSIISIKTNVSGSNFTFNEVQLKDIKEQFINLDGSKG